jgi:LysR family transcriptional regulator, transcriptional activator of nhaA
MTRLNYQHLYYFWVVAREGSIASATRILHLTQPTISGQLRTLARQVGKPLFERRGRGLALTETGEMVYAYASEIFALAHDLEEAVGGRSAGRSLRFAVGVSDALPKFTTYRLIAPALEIDTPLRPILRIGKTDALLVDLAAHRLDLVLADQPVPTGSAIRTFNHLLGDTAVTVFGTQDLVASVRRRFPHSLTGAPLLMPTANTALRRSLDAFLLTEDIRPRVVAEVEDVALLQVLGREGLGLFIAPSVVEADIRKAYGVQIAGRLPEVRERFYAIAAERRLTHPAVVALREAARSDLLVDPGD